MSCQSTPAMCCLLVSIITTYQCHQSCISVQPHQCL
ncbi:unnamed protein product, partial [Staurois parvus]